MTPEAGASPQTGSADLPALLIPQVVRKHECSSVDIQNCGRYANFVMYFTRTSFERHVSFDLSCRISAPIGVALP
jgi:hypothetical protein